MLLSIKFDLMSRQYTISDIDTGSVHDPIGDVNYDDLYVLFGFTSGNTKPVEFNNLKFGFNLRDMSTKNIVKAIAYPPIGIHYMRSDAEILEHVKISVTPGTKYRLDVWIQNNYLETKSNAWFEIPTYSNYELDFIETHPEQIDMQTFIAETKNDELDTRVY